MSLYLPLEKGMGLYLYGMAIHLYKLEASFPKDTFCQVWLKLAKYF